MRPNRTIVQVLAALLLGGQLVWASTIVGAAAPPQPAPLTIAVVGDQNTAGINNRQVWPTLMAARTGWSVFNCALPEAGFGSDGTGAQSFDYQVDRAQAGHPNVILLVTGTADASLGETESVTVGAVEALNKIIRGGQQVAIVGPIWYATPVPDSIWRVNDAVRKVAEEANVPFFDAIDPPLLSKELMHPDLSGPSDAGQSVIAGKIAEWIRTAVLR
ncbi:hypothetical protein CQY20_00940 [Mycolicibacterium agri]|uniref:SGNH hydrolase-type esterase domain-containing protein n=1 Tax=Mycolicibacterium agri TaxID=36811 RepID=A0A2A7NHA6_MYCAG|nr:hypothetical protein CQY20_00940 [Mycolicibacterium agri]